MITTISNYRYDMDEIKDKYKEGALINRSGLVARIILKLDKDGAIAISSNGKKSKISYSSLIRYRVCNNNAKEGDMVREAESGVSGYVLAVRDDMLKVLVNDGTLEIPAQNTVMLNKRFCEVSLEAYMNSRLRFKIKEKADIDEIIKFNHGRSWDDIVEVMRSSQPCQHVLGSHQISRDSYCQSQRRPLAVFYGKRGEQVYIPLKEIEPYFPKVIRRIQVGDTVRYIGHKINVKGVEFMTFIVSRVTPNRSNINLDVMTIHSKDIEFIQVYRKELKRINTVTIQQENEKDVVIQNYSIQPPSNT